LAEITQNVPKLHLQVKYLSKAFEEAYPEIKDLLERGEYKNVLFNLDQYGHSKVELETITDIIASSTRPKFSIRSELHRSLHFCENPIRSDWLMRLIR
jgi:hypothetical protein